MKNKKKRVEGWQAELDSRWDVACFSASTLKWLHTPGIQETGAAFTAARKKSHSPVTSQFLLNEAVNESVSSTQKKVDFNKEREAQTVSGHIHDTMHLFVETSAQPQLFQLRPSFF